MTFENKVKLLRSLPQFKVVPISEVRAIAFAANTKIELKKNSFELGQTGLFLNNEDLEKILRIYPDLESKLK